MAEPPQSIYLDGNTLGGGGQIIRIAVALAALMGKPITVDHVRGGRKTGGLRSSHVAAIRCLAQESGSETHGVHGKSTCFSFLPPQQGSDADKSSVKSSSEIKIDQPTPGSSALIFQAIYPYLLCRRAPASGKKPSMQLTISGNTNGDAAPSYEFLTQVLVPNFTVVGLPRLEISLAKRGWSTGVSKFGKLKIDMDVLGRYPSVDLSKYRRARISQIDISILAPNEEVRTPDVAQEKGKKKRKGQSNPTTVRTIRQLVEQETHKSLCNSLKGLPASLFHHEPTQHHHFCSKSSPPRCHSSFTSPEKRCSVVPINTLMTEATHDRSHLSVLIVAHTTNGFKIGQDASAMEPCECCEKRTHIKTKKTIDVARDVVERCVNRFIRQLYNPDLQAADHPGTEELHQPCVDDNMRDQFVIFEALARLKGIEPEPNSKEDERYWSLHTKTAQWVCDRMMNPN